MRNLKLVPEQDAFGTGFLVSDISARFSQSVHLQQPMNERAAEHVNNEYHERQQEALSRMLYDVYEAGREDMKAEFHELLRAKPTPKPYGVAR